MYIYVENDEFLDMLIDRLRNWTDDPDIIELYKQMYNNYIDEGVFENTSASVSEIVDNDYINYCDVIAEGDDDFNKLYDYYKRYGAGDCSTDFEDISYIEAVDNRDNPTLFLIRRI